MGIILILDTYKIFEELNGGHPYIILLTIPDIIGNAPERLLVVTYAYSLSKTKVANITRCWLPSLSWCIGSFLLSESQLLPLSYTVASGLLRPLESSNVLFLVIPKGPGGPWR